MSHLEQFYYSPQNGINTSQWSGIAQTSLDGSGDGLAWIFQMPADDTITHVGYVCAAVATPPVYKISIQGVTDFETPDGTIKGGGSPASATFTPGAGTFTWVALDNSYTASRGELLSVVILYDSGTIGASNDATFRHSMNSVSNFNSLPTISTTTDGGTNWVAIASDHAAFFGIRTSTSRFLYPFENELVQSLTSLSTGHKLTAKFTPPAGFSTLTCRGIRLRGQRTFGALNPVKVGAWDDAGTELASVTLTNGDEWDDNTAAFTEYLFDDTFQVSASTPVYLGLEQIAGSGATQLRASAFTFDSATDHGDFPYGTNFIKSTWNGSAWTDDDTIRMHIDLMAESQAAGGGGDIFIQRRKVR